VHSVLDLLLLKFMVLLVTGQGKTDGGSSPKVMIKFQLLSTSKVVSTGLVNPDFTICLILGCGAIFDPIV
jgi:hypothetical protein